MLVVLLFIVAMVMLPLESAHEYRNSVASPPLFWVNVERVVHWLKTIEFQSLGE
jgi:hypothetical protein